PVGSRAFYREAEAGIRDRNVTGVQTCALPIYTSVTTLTAVLAFLFLGAQSITAFAIALAVGLIVGTYSSLFLASLLWLVWRGKLIRKKPVNFTKKKRVEGPQV